MFSSVGSDHRLVCAKVCLSLRTPKKIARPRYNWNQFSLSPEIQERYTVAVKNWFQLLEGDSNGESYAKFVEANKQAMKECVPLRPKRKSVRTSTNPQVVAARRKAEEAHETWDREATEDNKVLWKEALRQLYETYDQVKEQELEEKTKTIEEAFGARQYGEG